MIHEVRNQPPPLVDYNLFTCDRALREAVSREGGGWACAQLEELGRRLGTAEVMEWAVQANENPPVLHTHDRYGHRRDEVLFHPAWHHLMRLAVEHGIHNLPWAQPRSGAHVARAALALLALENEAGHICPISMTYSAVPVLRLDPTLAAEWEPRIHSTAYDPSFRPAPEKAGVLVGMAMTEKQGGSDVRANITHAEPIGNGGYRLEGHKWFCSAPMNDAFLILAQAPRGLSCFFLPRWTPDGRRNAFHLQRLKSKLGAPWRRSAGRQEACAPKSCAPATRAWRSLYQLFHPMFPNPPAAASSNTWLWHCKPPCCCASALLPCQRHSVLRDSRTRVSRLALFRRSRTGPPCSRATDLTCAGTVALGFGLAQERSARDSMYNHSHTAGARVSTGVPMSLPGKCSATLFALQVMLAGSLCHIWANDQAIRSRPSSPSASIRVEVEAIMVPVSVTDAMDRPVPDLKKEDFHIFEDGAKQEIVSLSTIDVPASVGIIFDASSSMARKLTASVDAVDQFFKTAIPGDEFLLVRFSDRPHFITGFTPDIADISGWLHATRPHGLTALNDAIYLGIQKMKPARNGRKVLVVLSDGGDNNSSYSKRQLQRLVREADVQIYSISLLEGSSLLESISGETGGRMYRVRTAAELPDTIDKLSREIRSRYVLTYYSSHSRNDGKYRKLNVAVADPMLRVSWRRGYYAPVE